VQLAQWQDYSTLVGVAMARLPEWQTCSAVAESPRSAISGKIQVQVQAQCHSAEAALPHDVSLPAVVADAQYGGRLTTEVGLSLQWLNHSKLQPRCTQWQMHKTVAGTQHSGCRIRVQWLL